MARALLLLILAVVALAPAVRAAAPPGPAAGQTTARALPVGSRIPWQGRSGICMAPTCRT